MILKKIASALFSTRLMAILFLAFATSMAIGTFLENDYGTPAARIWVYNTWWFEAIMGIFLLNFLGNIFRYGLHKREKWPTLLLHLSFIFILLGAFITRYISYEGIMPIREGVTTNKFLSEKTYLQLLMVGDYNGDLKQRKVNTALELAAPTNNDFTVTTDFNKQPVTIEYIDYIEGAELGLVPNDDGELHLKLVEAGEGKRHEHYLKAGEVSNIHNILYAFNKPTEGAINITYDKGNYSIYSPFEGSFMRMADQLQGTVIRDSVQELQLRSLYQMAGTQFVIPEPPVKGNYDVIPTKIKEKGQENALVVDITTKNETKRLKLLGGKGFVNDFKQVNMGGLELSLRYGSQELELPFSLKLNDFIATKYPGTEKGYASYKSKVDLVEDGKSIPKEIFMNNVLDHKGFRFFQASFDPDEKGTVLSVNHDFWGSWITYLGYSLLYIGLMAILLIKGSRFKKLEKSLNKIKLKKAALGLVLVCGIVNVTSVKAQSALPTDVSLRPTKKQLDSLVKANAVSPEHAEKFGSIVIQDESGRMKPINTFASELLRKLSKRTKYEGLSSDQVFISMQENPIAWYNIPLIYIDWKNDSIRKILGVPKKASRVALVDLFEKDGTYKLAPYLDAATSTNTPNQFEKDFIKTHEKFYLLNSALSGSVFRVFPLPNDENNKWVSPPMLNEEKFSGIDSVYTRQILPIYRSSLLEARQTGDYSKPDKYLSSIKNFQKKYGSVVLPSEKKVETEILYNKYDIFRKLYTYYSLAGLLMIIFTIIQIFKKNKVTRILVGISKYSIILLFIMHTLGLIARWYVSGHAPWSDAYESMIYVGWATMFFGIALGRKSDLTIGATAFVASIILWVAHMNWMDPEIANLQPVLNSYWLMIHVAVIVASYGPFILGAILGVVALLLMVLTTKKNKKKMKLNIEELTIVNEMSLTIGLVMLTIGNFLGGQWANESWGRYWGWDPKETWALISIMIYAFVIHMRLVPGLRGKWIYNFVSMIAVSTIMMTYFGVNFYLSGLHSYASGDQVITPTFVYYTITGAFVLGAISLWRYRVHYKK
ncbi:cytochrome c biogenesis protein [Aquimarina agarilytica]|uniref:cytochrome c biogenesis protein n=1 Tax=Aquimarina agarilytica TaxID=1087449 RepID=UPI00028A17C3|nr:cytochrome c biogenesis protein CcsA [Aquimarina agarilytica]